MRSDDAISTNHVNKEQYTTRLLLVGLLGHYTFVAGRDSVTSAPLPSRGVVCLASLLRLLVSVCVRFSLRRQF